MSRFLAQATLTLLSLTVGLPAYAEAGGTSALWPWFSLILVLMLGATVFFCFWLQKHMNQLQQRLLNEAAATEEARKHLQEVLAEDRFRTTFFHGSSHELRTPLNGIIGFLQLLFQGQYGPLPRSARTQISKCMMLAESLKHQITTILDLADGRRGHLQLRNSRVNLHQLLNEIETMAEGLRLRHPDCQFEMQKPGLNEDAIFIHDHAKLLMMLRSLIGNAFQFGKPQERNHVLLTLGRRHRALILEISDRGVGLSSDQISRIFDDQSPQAESSGLGLPMVRILLRLMQGEMKISSEPGQGSRFTLVIPEQSAVHEDQASPEILPLPRRQETLHQDSLKAETQPSPNQLKMDGYAAHILVVDDNALNCEIIQEILMPQGYRVSLAYGGREALSRLRLDRPDLMLLDLSMPEFSGEQVMQEKQLDSSLAEIPVILITARASEHDRIHGLDLGADDYLTKPIIHQELVLRVRNLLSRQRLTRRIAQMEEREKLAQLGELITDLSREIRDSWTTRPDAATGLALCQQAMAALPEAENLGRGFASIALGEQDAGDAIDLEALPLPKTASESLVSLRALRLQLAPAPLKATEKNRIWQILQSLSAPQLLLWQSITALASNHRLLMEQSQKSRLLMDGILELQKRAPQRVCRVDQTLSKTAILLGPRLRLAGVRLQMELLPQTLMIHPADLMQVGISLITVLCQRLERLLDQDKWLNISTHPQEDLLLIRFTCGGPRLTEAQALRLFDPVTEGPDVHDHSGLHVARRIVLRAPGRLDFNLNEANSCLELELPKALTGIY